MVFQISIPGVDSVARIQWRPERRHHIASISLVMDCTVSVWDVRRPFLPLMCFSKHTDVPTALAWRGHPDVILTTSKDQTLVQVSRRTWYKVLASKS